MTTIYETFLERGNEHARLIREYARQCYLVSEENHPIEDETKAYNDVMKNLRQSFIAMVEGMKEDLDGLEYDTSIDSVIINGDYYINGKDLYSRLESELIKLKEN